MLQEKVVLFANTREMAPRLGGVERISNELALEFTKRGYKVIFLAGFSVENQQFYAESIPKYYLPNQNENEYDSEENVDYFVHVILDENVTTIINQAGNIENFSRLCIKAAESVDGVKVISAIHTQPDYVLAQLRDFRITPVKKLSYLKGARRLVLYPFRERRLVRDERRKYQFILEKSDAVVVLSECYRKMLCELAGDVSCKMLSKVTAIGNFTSMTYGYMQGVKEKTVLWIGRMDFDTKRPDRIITMWEKIWKRYPEWKLDMVGDGPYLATLKDYVRKKKLGNIVFYGNCNPIPFYEKASILCLTSTIEGLPMVLLEGMAAGCVPIVYDSFASSKDIIQNGINGFRIPSFSKKKYVKCLIKLMTDEKEREKISVKGEIIEDQNDIIKKWECLL